MYYLFLTKGKYEDFIQKFEATKTAINKGKTPVYSELRCARTNLIEVLPHYVIQSFFLIAGTLILQKINVSETVKLALVLLINAICGTVANSIFVFIKHFFRVKMLVKMGLEVTEENVSVLESLEYQSV